MEEKFECKKCGKCCSRIGGESEDSEITKDFFGKLPIVQLIQNKNVMPIFDWEAKALKEEAEKQKINVDIRPLRAVLDMDSNTAIILSYYIDAEKCPMLENNMCRVYDKRPLVCRQFPLQRGHDVDQETVANCPAEKVPGFSDDTLSFYFGGSFDSAKERDLLVEKQGRIVVDLIRQNKIRPAMNYPYEFLVKRIENAEKIDMIDFLNKNNIEVK